MRRIAIAFSLVVAAAAPGRAQGAADVQACVAVADPVRRAIEACTRLIASGRYAGRDLSALHTNRGTGHRLLGRYGRALEDHDAAVRIDPRNARAWHNRGNVLYFLGRFEEAIESSSRAIALDAKIGIAWEQRGFSQYRLGRYDAAIRDYDAALPLLPGRALTLWARSLAWRKKGDPARAAADLAAAKRIQADVETGYRHLGLE